MITQEKISEISYTIIGCAIEVHRELEPGLLESHYEECFIEELQTAGLLVKSQLKLPIYYKGKKLRRHLKLDLIVEDIIVVENKAKEKMIPLYEAQLLSHMNLTEKVKGLLINFNSVNISKSIVSLVTPEFFKLPER